MTEIEKLLGMSTEELEKMSAEQLTEYLKPCFMFTRPEKVAATKRLSRKEAEKILLDSMMNILSSSASESK